MLSKIYSLEGTSVIKFCKATYSSDSVSIGILYRRQLSSIPAFFSNLELLNNSSKINVLLGDFNLNDLDPRLFEEKSNTLSNYCLLNSDSTHLNDCLIDQLHVWKAFLDISHINVSEFSMYNFQIMMLCKWCSGQINIWLEFFSAAVSPRTLLPFFIIVFVIYF